MSALLEIVDSIDRPPIPFETVGLIRQALAGQELSILSDQGRSCADECIRILRLRLQSTEEAGKKYIGAKHALTALGFLEPTECVKITHLSSKDLLVTLYVGGKREEPIALTLIEKTRQAQ